MNLTEVNLSAFVIDGQLQIEELAEAVKVATRIGLRQTNVTLDLPAWDVVQKRDRLTGVSLSGVVDAQDALGYSKDEMEVLFGALNTIANNEAIRYAKEMRIPTPLLVTTV